MERLKGILARIDGRGYGAYKDIRGAWQYPRMTLHVDHVQGDPFASPSRLRLEIPARVAGFPAELWNTPTRRIALEDFLVRVLAAALPVRGGERDGSGKSGEIGVCRATQQVLWRSAVRVTASGLEVRVTCGLPARGRKVLGRAAERLLCVDLPQLAARLEYAALDATAVRTHVDSVEDQHALRAQVVENGWAAFVADGAVLPRNSGVDERPLADGLRFKRPPTLAATVHLPHAGEVTGMLVPAGVTLIVGGGFHGKSTLLNALETGVYDHIPGDGRERVVTDPTAVKVRAEDGRQVTGVDISPFISNLPFGRATDRFSTQNASGSTSQAANIVEALYAGCRLLLIDEDTSATNFMMRDARMQKLVRGEQEPITPLLHRVRELYDRHRVSSVVVMGGSGDWFEVADTVIRMDSYQPSDVTAEARALAEPRQLGDLSGLSPMVIAEPPGRAPALSSARGRREVKITARDRDTLEYGTHTIDLSRVEQVADVAQTRAIGWLLHRYFENYADGGIATEGLAAPLADLQENGFDGLTPWPMGDLAAPRLFELAAALNRVRHINR
ncbi:MAG: ABC-ATPase domain-containing protein [Nitrospirota bacterium]|nr:ABC-ATPase domain-containing protein [Nitrospirota bacterium]